MCADVCTDMCADMCTDMRTDQYQDMGTDMGADMGAHMGADMGAAIRIDIHTHMWIDRFADIGTDMCIDRFADICAEMLTIAGIGCLGFIPHVIIISYMILTNYNGIKHIWTGIPNTAYVTWYNQSAS